jgi:diaminohydroxyphosphoribosylaminopyrimidine deaminase/5-amino-6-(5-phosphoribosylamino)uracil reductase
MRDPFPEVAGKGIAQLCQAGIEVEVGLGEAEARTLNAPYLKLLATGRPYVHAKWAMSLDGKIATRVGDSKWISGASARNRGHELRGRMDAIVVGIGTVLADDPLLTARPAGPRTATRVVLDSRGRLPFDSQLVRSVADAPVLVAIAEENASTDALVRRGCEILVTPSERGQVSIPALLDELGRRRMTNILVEGGGQVLGGFLDLHAIDEVHAFIAPVLVGGGHAPSPVAGVGSARLAEAIHLTSPTVELLDDDLYVAARLPPWGDPG